MKIIKKAFQILQLFLDHGEELTLGELSSLSGLNKPTTRRIALALMQCGFLQQQKNRGRYALGMKFIDFSQAVKKQSHIVDVAEPLLDRLNLETNETVALAVWDGRQAVICQAIHPNHPLKVTAYEGTMSGLYFNSLGKAILAALPEEDIEKFVTGELHSFTTNTITSLNSLKNHLLLVRQEGVAVDDEEGFQGIRGLAAVFRDKTGEIAGAITIIGPTVRLTREKSRAFIPMVKDCADRISTALGYDERTFTGQRRSASTSGRLLK